MDRWKMAQTEWERPLIICWIGVGPDQVAFIASVSDLTTTTTTLVGAVHHSRCDDQVPNQATKRWIGIDDRTGFSLANDGPHSS